MEITGKVLLAPRESRARGGGGAPAADTRAATATPGAKPGAPAPEMAHTEQDAFDCTPPDGHGSLWL